MASVTITATFYSAVDVALAAPATLPSITIRRTDTQAIVAGPSSMVEVGEGNYAFDFTSVDGLWYTVSVDGDPLAAGQTVGGGRFAKGGFSGSWAERVLVDVASIDGRIPVALVGGRMDSDVGGMQAGVIGPGVMAASAITAATLATDSITSDELAASAIAEIQSGLATSAAVADIAAVTRFRTSAASVFDLPAASFVDFKIAVNLEDTDGNPEDPDASTITVGVTNHLGASRVANLQGGAVMTQLSTGRYEIEYRVASTHAIEELRFSFTYDENAVTFIKDMMRQVADYDTIGFTAADRTTIANIETDTNEVQGKLPTNFLMGSSDVDDHDTQIENIQTRIPAALVGGAMNADISNIQSAALTQIENEILDALIAGHLGAGTVGLAISDASAAGASAAVITRILGLVQDNFMLDEQTYDSKGLLLTGRIRTFASAAALGLASALAADDADSEIARYNIITDPPAIPGEATDYRVFREL